MSRVHGSWLQPLSVSLTLVALGYAVAASSIAYADENSSPLDHSGAARDRSSPPTYARAEFDSKLLMGGSTHSIDVSRFMEGNQPEPGSYDFDIYLNESWLLRETVQLAKVDGQIRYCLTPSMFHRFAANEKLISAEGIAALNQARAGDCIDLTQIVSGSTVSLNINRLRMDISIPQAMLLSRPREYVDPSQWNYGVTAATLGYRANYYHTDAKRSTDSGYIGLNGGLNLGRWRLRHEGSFNIDASDVRYTGIVTYVERDISAIKARVTVGDTFSDGAIFDSIGIRGVKLARQDQMLPQSLQGYAPVIRGTARTNARVTVSQNGRTLYEETVAPGPFVIRDLYSTGYGAALQVTVTESDGGANTFTIPNAALPQLLRPGRLRFNIEAGELRDGVAGNRPSMLQATGQYGLSNTFTLYGGGTLSDGYRSAAVGLAMNTRFGAISADLAGSIFDIPDEGTKTGHRARLTYSNFFAPTQTNLAIAAYMQTSRDFWDLRNAVQLVDFKSSARSLYIQRERRRIQASINQSLGKVGSLYFSGSLMQFWDRGSMTTAQAGYSRNFRLRNLPLSASINYSRMDDVATGRSENRVQAMVTLPLGSGSRRPTVSATTTYEDDRPSSQQVRINGAALTDQQLNYGVSLDHREGDVRVGGNAEYRGSAVALSASASIDGDTQQYSLGARGGVVIHPGGVTLANQLGGAIGVLEARGAKGARVPYGQGTKVDKRGYAVVPHLIPYRVNTVGVDPQGLPLDVQLRTSSVQVVPSGDAVVMLRYATDEGGSAVMMIKNSDGGPVPFGASLADEAGTEKGIVGQQGRAFASGLQKAGALFVITQGGEQQCRIDYTLPRSNGAAYPVIDTICKPIIPVDEVVLDAKADLHVEGGALPRPRFSVFGTGD